MLEGATMHARDSVHGSLASCFVTIDGRRLNFMSLTDFESIYEINITDVPIRGRINMGHKAAGGNGTWSGTAHYNQSHIRAFVDEYQKTGVMPYFEIQVTNEDPTTRIGRQTIIHHDCLCDSVVLAKFETGAEVLTEELSGTFESWDMPETFADLEGM